MQEFHYAFGGTCLIALDVRFPYDEPVNDETVYQWIVNKLKPASERIDIVQDFQTMRLSEDIHHWISHARTAITRHRD